MVRAVQVYVQHKMKQVGKQLCAALHEQGGYVFVCGDGLHMAADVHSTIKDIVAEHAGLSADQAEDFLRELAAEKRYVKDVWL
jgi:sulfite reductase (NADPH) flavoprotein alpha-component